MDDLHSTDFLWPTECELLHHLVSLQNEGFAWDDSERGHFREDFFPPIKIPVVAHTLGRAKYTNTAWHLQ